MVLKLRLARFGRRNSPFYNIVVAHARTARNSKPLEVLGTYDPIPKQDTYAAPGKKMHKDIKLDITRAKYWVGVGAQPTEPVWRLLSLLKILEPRRPPPSIPDMRRRKPTLMETESAPKKPTLKKTTRREEAPKPPTDSTTGPTPEERKPRPPLELSAALRSAVAGRIAIRAKNNAAKAADKLVLKKLVTKKSVSDKKPAFREKAAYTEKPPAIEKLVSTEKPTSETSPEPKPTSL